MENWRIFRRLIGHDNDVQDLGWSYDGTILVSVGLDSKVVVWSGHTFEKLKTLSNHQSHVKGITFDPANKYFATASDDRTVKIFRFTSPGPNSTSHDQMNNFVLETTISAPFTNSPLTTYFRRCSWSPDGIHIAAANAVNGPVSSIVIINRGQWDGDTTLIGHEGPVEVCAFSPRLYGAEPPGKGQPEAHVANHTTVIACAGADKCLSIWSTSNPRPVIVTQDLANKPICDLSWSPDGMNLFITALDGSIIAVMFEEGELGYPRSIEENERSLTKYGTGRKGAGVIETPEAFLLEERSKAGELKGVEGRMGALMGDLHSSQPKTNGTAKVNGVNTTPALTNGTTVPEPANNEDPGQPKVDPNQAKLERLKSRVEYTKDGKKRIRPLLVSGAGATESSLPQSRLVNASATMQPLDAPQSILDLSKPFDGLPKGGLAALLLGNKRKLAQIDGEEEGHVEKKIALASQKGTTPILVNGADGLLPAQTQPAVTGQQPTPEFIRPAVLNPVLMVSQLRLAVPKVRIHIVQGIDSSGNPADISAESKSKADLILEARNPAVQSLTGRVQDREPCRVTLTRRDQPLWQDFLPRTVLLVTGTKIFWAAADESGSIYIWTSAGRRLVNALVMEAQPVILSSYGSWLLCITAVGMCYVWNIKTMTSPHPPVSLAPVLDAAIHSLTPHPTNAPSITNARLNSEGRIIITLSNGDGYAYSPQMFTWQRLSEVWWAVGSQYWNTTDSSVSNIQAKDRDGKEVATNVSVGIVPFLERNTTNETLLRGRAYFLQRLIKVLLSREGFESFESSTSIAHLENRVAAALMLGAKDEFRLYLLMYAKRLGAEGLRLKVEELLKTLLGGIIEESDEEDLPVKVSKDILQERTWQGDADRICGWSRNQLLRDVVLLLGNSKTHVLSDSRMLYADLQQGNTGTFSGSLCLMRNYWEFWTKFLTARKTWFCDLRAVEFSVGVQGNSIPRENHDILFCSRLCMWGVFMTPASGRLYLDCRMTDLKEQSG